MSRQTPPAPKTLLQEQGVVSRQLHVFSSSTSGGATTGTHVFSFLTDRSRRNITHHQCHSVPKENGLFSFLSFPFLTARPSLPSTLGCGALCGGRDPPVMKHEGRGPPGRRRRRRCEPPAMEAPLTPLGCRYGGDPLGASSSLPAPSPRPASKSATEPLHGNNEAAEPRVRVATTVSGIGSEPLPQKLHGRATPWWSSWWSIAGRNRRGAVPNRPLVR